MAIDDGSFLLETYECDYASELYADGKLYVTLPNGISAPASFNVKIEWEEMKYKGMGGGVGDGSDTDYEILKTIQNGNYNTIKNMSSISYTANISNSGRTLRITKAKFNGFRALPFKLYFRAKITIGNGLNDTPIYSRIASVRLHPCPLQVISDIKLHQSPNKNIGLLLKIKKISFKNPSVKDVAENTSKSIPIMTKECLDGEYGINDPWSSLSISNFSTMNNKIIVTPRVKENDTYILLGDPDTVSEIIESIWDPGVGYYRDYNHIVPGMFNIQQMGDDDEKPPYGGLTFSAMKVDWADASKLQPGSPEFIKKYNQAKGTNCPLIIKRGNIKIGITDGEKKINGSPYTKSREDSTVILTNNITLFDVNHPKAGLNFEVIEVIGVKDQETSENAIVCYNSC